MGGRTHSHQSLIECSTEPPSLHHFSGECVEHVKGKCVVCVRV